MISNTNRLVLATITLMLLFCALPCILKYRYSANLHRSFSFSMHDFCINLGRQRIPSRRFAIGGFWQRDLRQVAVRSEV